MFIHFGLSPRAGSAPSTRLRAVCSSIVRSMAGDVIPTPRINADTKKLVLIDIS
jgi:hypothetical protein